MVTYCYLRILSLGWSILDDNFGAFHLNIFGIYILNYDNLYHLSRVITAEVMKGHLFLFNSDLNQIGWCRIDSCKNLR